MAYCRHNHRLLTIVEKNSSQMARGTASTYLLSLYQQVCIILFSKTYKSTYFFIFRGTIASRGNYFLCFVLCTTSTSYHGRASCIQHNLRPMRPFLLVYFKSNLKSKQLFFRVIILPCTRTTVHSLSYFPAASSTNLIL